MLVSSSTIKRTKAADEGAGSPAVATALPLLEVPAFPATQKLSLSYSSERERERD